MGSLLRTSVIALFITAVSSVPADPAGRIYHQPDGSETPLIYLHRDEHTNWMADAMGYTVMQDTQSWWVYSKNKGGNLISSGVRVGYGNPRKLGLTKNLQSDESKRRVKENEVKEHRNLLDIPSTAICNFEGTKEAPCVLKNLVLLVRFSDHDERDLPAPEEYEMLFNHIGPGTNDTAPTGSVADVFRVNSYGKFLLVSTITPWIRVNRTEAQTVDDNLGLNRVETRTTWREAMVILESTGFSFDAMDENMDSVIDCLVILHSGSAAEISGHDCESYKNHTQRIWSHATAQTWFVSSDGIRNYRYYVASGVWSICPSLGSGQKWGIARIAIIAHECAHFLGLPDLYGSGNGSGVGNFDLLAYMWGWSGSQKMPPLMGAWSKYKLQWANVVHITSSGAYQLGPSCTNDTIYLIDHNMPLGEYFLIENRYPCSFDADLRYFLEIEGLDRNGAAVWHIDESGILGDAIHYRSEGYPGDGVYPALHYMVALVQADGNWDLEQGMNKGDSFDLFRRSNSPHQANTAYRIGPHGLDMNNASSKTSPNTNSYAHGYEQYTGITIEFGPATASMTMTVTLDGAPEFLVNDIAPSPSSSLSLTQVKIEAPTLKPSLTPTQSITPMMPVWTPSSPKIWSSSQTAMPTFSPAFRLPTLAEVTTEAPTLKPS